MKLKCWDDNNEVWINEGDPETEFICNNGVWTVRYQDEINIPGFEGVPERDVPVWREVENPLVVEA